MNGTPSSPSVQVVDVVHRREGHPAETRPDKVAREEPLEIRVRGQAVAVTLRTPGHDTELAAGFLLTEGVLRRRADVVEIAPCPAADPPENTLNVFLAPSVEVDFARLTRHVFSSSSCGLCGKATIDAVHGAFPPVENGPVVSGALLARMPGKMRREQHAFDDTGGLHAAALFTPEGDLVVLREDVGRHNAVDKVLGHEFLAGRFPLEDRVLLVSGRVSFEITQKALAARIAVVCAVSAPSSLAVTFARESGQTLVGFLREGRMNLYSHPERVLD